MNRLCAELSGDRPWAFVNVNIRPFYAEGSKTLGYEVAEQLGWRLPEQVVIPMASGSLLTKVDKAFRELGKLGLVEPTPLPGVRRAVDRLLPDRRPRSSAGWEVPRPVRPDTIAKSLAIGNPADGPYALDVVRRTGGAIEDVADDEIGRGDPAARPDRGHLRRDGRWGDAGLPAASCSPTGAWTRTPRRSCSTPATG